MSGLIAIKLWPCSNKQSVNIRQSLQYTAAKCFIRQTTEIIRWVQCKMQTYYHYKLLSLPAKKYYCLQLSSSIKQEIVKQYFTCWVEALARVQSAASKHQLKLYYSCWNTSSDFCERKKLTRHRKAATVLHISMVAMTCNGCGYATRQLVKPTQAQCTLCFAARCRKMSYMHLLHNLDQEIN